MIDLCSNCGIRSVDNYYNFGLCDECTKEIANEIGCEMDLGEDWDNECEDDFHGD